MIRHSLACLVSLALSGAAFAADPGTGNPAGMAPIAAGETRHAGTACS
jgi:hypothetical protein